MVILSKSLGFGRQQTDDMFVMCVIGEGAPVYGVEPTIDWESEHCVPDNGGCPHRWCRADRWLADCPRVGTGSMNGWTHWWCSMAS